MISLPVMQIDDLKLNTTLIEQYEKYLAIRTQFLLNRFRKYPDFPGVQTGYDSITGKEFPKGHLHSYSWINGRGACVFARFADYFPSRHDELMLASLHAIEVMEKHREMNDGRFPFMVNKDGTEHIAGQPLPPGNISYSDLYACFGFLEYGSKADDYRRIEAAQKIFNGSLSALKENRFTAEPEPIEESLIFENPRSVALDLANEFTKQLNDTLYLDRSAELIDFLLEHFYLEDPGAFIEYITLDKRPFFNDYGSWTVDPGHAIEFASFSLEFSRLAEKNNVHSELCKKINGICPDLILWNIEKGWDQKYLGIYKTIDAVTGAALNDTMPWWILPEAMLALLLAYERKADKVFLKWFKDIHNAYFQYYMNPRTDWGPYQNRDGKSGKPVDIPPACKFQDPEFHSGKNILTIIDVIRRIHNEL
jgi:mannose/cellobiose epimerase-like protein (N-acyl-D-glucosamine 2-epimerase family)